MMRRTAKESREFVTCPGSRFYVEKHGEVQPNGIIKLVPDKEIDLQEKYNAEYPATTIDNILANSNPMEYFGDDGLHGLDCTNLPQTFAEFLQLQIDRKREFDLLPIEIKQKFNNDVSQFMATAGSDDWFSKLGIELKKEVDTSVPVDTDTINKE